MALVKYNNNSISAITSTGLTAGAMTLIKEQTASSSSTISFVHGTSDVVLDSTYPIYVFKFYDIHVATDDKDFLFNMSVDGGSNYNVTKTTTFFEGYHNEGDSSAGLQYNTGFDLAQSTSGQVLFHSVGNQNDESCAGTLHLFNPSSTTFVKHFLFTGNNYNQDDFLINAFVGGYGNTTSAVNAVQFSMESGNIDSGTIKLYGIKDS